MTMRLILMRHAKAERPPALSDLDRPLSERGRRDAGRAGAYLAADGLMPARALVSPARRTMQTWEGLAPHLSGCTPETVPRLYDAPAERILDAVRAAPGEATCLLVVGHNPGLRDLAELLARADTSMGPSLPTSALAVLEFEVAGWEAIGAGGGRLARFVEPRDFPA